MNDLFITSIHLLSFAEMKYDKLLLSRTMFCRLEDKQKKRNEMCCKDASTTSFIVGSGQFFCLGKRQTILQPFYYPQKTILPHFTAYQSFLFHFTAKKKKIISLAISLNSFKCTTHRSNLPRKLQIYISLSHLARSLYTGIVSKNLPIFKQIIIVPSSSHRRTSNIECRKKKKNFLENIKFTVHYIRFSASSSAGIERKRQII